MKKIVTFLQQQQNKDGSFNSYSSNSASFKKHSPTQTTFITSLILDLLCQVKEPNREVQEIQSALATYLLNQRSSHWTWNYWDKNSELYTHKPYPDDADDTFAALNALHTYDPLCIDGEALAHIVTGLTLIEKHEGGPYTTWYTNSDAQEWNDTDIVVNTRILRFLKNQNITVPPLERFVENAIHNLSSLSSPYYPSHIPILYELSRIPMGEPHKIAQYCQRTHDNSPLHKALCSLISNNFNVLDEYPNIESFSSVSPICYDPMIHGETYFAGAPALTAAACLAASSVEINSRITQKPHQNKLKLMQEMLLDSIQKECLALPSPSSEVLQKAVSMMGDKALKDSQIMLLPYLFYQNCTGGDHEAFDEKIMKSLCTAHFYGWCAYTAYDDILDEDSDYKALNIPNIFLTKCIDAFYEATPPSFHPHIRDTLHVIDNSMYWEKQNAWIPVSRNFKPHNHMIAQKSYGHMIAPLAILHMLGYSFTSEEYCATKRFFQHYILARQLGDDAHDWEEDIAAGYVNPIAYQLFTIDQLAKPVTQKLRDSAREVFWDSVVLDVCSLIESHCKKAEDALQEMTFLRSQNMLQELIDDKRSMIQHTLDQQKKAKDFIKTYSRN